MNIVVIGGGAAGSSAAVRAKRANMSSNVFLIEATDMVTHGPCAIPYYVEGLVKDRSQLVTYTPRYLEENRGIRVLVNTRAVEIELDGRFVVIEKPNGVKERIKWDKLVIASGAKPISLISKEMENVITIRHPAYADRVREVLSRAGVVGIIGAGYLGIEMAEAISALGKKVLLFEKSPHVLPGALDPDIASIVEDEILRKGVEIHLNEPVREIVGDNTAEKIVTDIGEYRVDAVVMAIGVRPNTDLVAGLGIRLGASGAIAVNEYMETSVEDIYAAGDVAEKYHRVLRKKVWIPLATTANKEGQVAGANAARGRVLMFKGIVGTAVTKFYDLYIARTGLTEGEAAANGIRYRAKTVRVRTKAHYYPGSSEAVIKMVVDEEDRIIGVQAVGRDTSVAHYIDVAAVAIERGMTIEDLFMSDLGYMPATSPVWHPLIVAARVLSEGRF